MMNVCGWLRERWLICAWNDALYSYSFAFNYHRLQQQSQQALPLISI
jgi:hypothetical protein